MKPRVGTTLGLGDEEEHQRRRCCVKEVRDAPIVVERHHHAVLSTQSRVPFLENPRLRLETHRYVGGVAKALRRQPLIVGGVADPVHLLTTLARAVSFAYLTRIGGSIPVSAMAIADFVKFDERRLWD